MQYAQKGLYKFCYYRTQSILLQASPFQTDSELEQQCHCQLFLQKVFRNPGMLHGRGAEIYMSVCQPLCGCRALVFSYQYFTIRLSAPSLASRLLMQ